MSNARNISAIHDKNLIRAYVNFKGTGTVSINESLGCSSVTDHGTGTYSPNWDAGVFTTNTYAYVTFGRDPGTDATMINNVASSSSYGKTTGVTTIRYNYQGTDYDSPEVSMILVGGQ